MVSYGFPSSLCKRLPEGFQRVSVTPMAPMLIQPAGAEMSLGTDAARRRAVAEDPVAESWDFAVKP